MKEQREREREKGKGKESVLPDGGERGAGTETGARQGNQCQCQCCQTLVTVGCQLTFRRKQQKNC